MLAIKSESAPTLSAGAMTMTFGQFEKVSEALVSFDGPNVDDYVFEATRSIAAATNVVTITFKKQQASAASPAWGAAGDNDITGVVTVVAKGY